MSGIFPSERSAREAFDRLLAEGLPRERVALGIDMTADGVAAEAPGQSYENQPGQAAAESTMSWYGEAVRAGTCAVTIDAEDAAQLRDVERKLLAYGARQVARPAAR